MSCSSATRLAFLPSRHLFFTLFVVVFFLSKNCNLFFDFQEVKATYVEQIKDLNQSLELVGNS